MLDGSSSESSDDLEERTSDSMATKQKEPEEDFGDEDSPLENAAKDLLNEMPLVRKYFVSFALFCTSKY